MESINEKMLRGLEAYSKGRQRQIDSQKSALNEQLMLRKLLAYDQPEPLNALQQLQFEEKKKKIEDAKQSALDRDELLKESAQDTLRTIGAVKQGARYFGPLGQLPTALTPSVFGDYRSRANWEANVNKLLSQKVLDTMTAMKQASKTGATGFGQLSNKELAVLQEASTALKRYLAPEDALRYLNEMETIHKKVLGVGGEENLKSFNTPSEADASGLPTGTKVMVAGRPYEI